MSGPTLDEIFRDVVWATSLPHEPVYPNMCQANKFTIYMVNILIMRHRGLDIEAYMKNIFERDPDSYPRLGRSAKWYLLNNYLREYLLEQAAAKRNRRLSKSM